MKYYLSILYALMKNNLVRETEFRSNFILSFVLEISSLIISIFILEVQFSYTNTLAGWTKPHVFLLIGIFSIVSNLVEVTFIRNIRQIPDYVENGTLDVFLTKPISSQFLVSLRYIYIMKGAGVIAGIGMVVFALLRGAISVTLTSGIASIVTFISGTIIYYSLFLLFASLSFWTTRLSTVYNLYYSTKTILSVPVAVFGRKGKALLTYLIPLAFVVTFPAGLLAGREAFWYAPLSVAIACLFFLLSRWVWNVGLKRYSGASS